MEGTTAATALFAGGCFWCMEGPFEAEEGVHEVRSGYTGGRSADPSYGEVSSGRTGHREAIEVRYDPRKIGYERLLDIFWRQIDPTDPGGQFADRGEQYTTAVFYADETQRELALASKKELEQSGKFDKPVVTDILPAGPFYPAEEYHQDYYTKNPGHYYRYRLGSGRAGFLDSVWGDDPLPPASTEWRGDAFVKPPRDSLKKSLSRLQFRVTQNNGTEPAFNNEFWDNHEQGIYVDIVSGEPLFASVHKFESGTGWPSFRRPLVDSHVVERSDRSFGMVRTEVRSRFADSHLGHLFDDGPPPTGLRYCINSAALRFVPKEKLREEGYGRYVALFE